jgi:type I restriction enzyme S subunit
MSFPRYPKYRPSGVDWLGEVPEGWPTVNSRRLFHLANERAKTDDVQLTASQKYGVVPQALFMETEGHKVALALSGLGNFKHVEEDDFVISLRSFQGGIERSKYSGCVSPAYTVLRPAEPIDANYWGYLLKSRRYVEILQTMNDGLRDGKSISYQQFGHIPLPLPPLPEQTAIAEFLDQETGKIDELVAEQRRLIELLKEKRQAVISHAVTKGLNPDAPMKPSGIEWLGDVPRGWEVMKLKHLTTSVEQGWSPQCDNRPVETEADWGVLKVGCVNGGVFRPSENKALPIDLEPFPELAIARGDLLVSRANTRELVGSSAVADKDYRNLLLCDKLYRLRFYQDRCLPVFVCYYIGSSVVRGRIELDATGASSSMLNISQSAILELKIAIPPLNEQSEIIATLESKLREFDTLTAEANRAIDLLQERRTALISAAVTGQIDVSAIYMVP